MKKLLSYLKLGDVVGERVGVLLNYGYLNISVGFIGIGALIIITQTYVTDIVGSKLGLQINPDKNKHTSIDEIS